MSAPFDSLGVDVAFAGVVITLAGIFLTPMRGVVLRATRPGGRGQGPAAVSEMQAEPAAATPAGAAPQPAKPVAKPAMKALGAADPRVDYREHEALFARTLLTAQKAAEDLVRNAEAEAQDIIAQAEAAAAETARASRKNASETIQQAQGDADIIVASAKQKATAWLALLQAEADKLAVDAHQAFQGAQRTVEQNVATLAARFERRMAEWDADPWEEQRAAASLDGAAGPAAERASTRIA
jgi:cell division septum initiation protein DivIVA